MKLTELLKLTEAFCFVEIYLNGKQLILSGEVCEISANINVNKVDYKVLYIGIDPRGLQLEIHVCYVDKGELPC